MEIEELISERDKALIAKLRSAIDDPATSAADREVFRDELGCIAHGYANLDALTDDERREYLAERSTALKATV